MASRVKFLILFSGRCGGTLLQRSLNNHPMIHCEGEILQGQPFPEQLKLLDWAYDHLGGDIRAAGLKTKLMETRSRDHPRLTEYLKRHNVSIVHLYRENPIKHALSHVTVRQLVERTGHWETYRDEDRARPVTLDMQAFRATLLYIEEFERRTHCFSLQFERVLHVSYEKLASQLVPTLEEIQRFLQVPVRDDIVEPLKKVTPDDLGEAIANYDEASIEMFRMMELGGGRESAFYRYLDHKEDLMARLVRVSPKQCALWVEKAWLHLDDGDLTAAVQCAERAAELEPENMGVLELQEEIRRRQS